jgi:hypothetical protein
MTRAVSFSTLPAFFRAFLRLRLKVLSFCFGLLAKMTVSPWLFASVCFSMGIQSCFGLGQERYVEFTKPRSGFRLVEGGTAATIVVDTNDFAGVVRAAGDLQHDVERVTGRKPSMAYYQSTVEPGAVLVGTIGKSALIDQLIRDRKIDVAGIRGKWESFLIQVVHKPLPGLDSALVIAGSDKRGTIYGLYDLSEQIGVSPWYFFADVPITHHDSLFIKAERHIQGPPVVKYRGIFLNDEAPDLTGWVKEKFGDYNHAFYTNIFELLLRMKANYLWPAMWNNCFNEDDPLNPKLADEYGIVMGTSHVEPMMRADKEWNRKGYKASQWNYQKNPEELRDFWKEGLERNKAYESLITIAMRGKIDTPMSETANIALLERIVADQRKIIEDVYHTNVAAVPQLWALYKEVQEYYEKGMRVPDDVTLLWCDDNWGNNRRLPTPEERHRSGGAGIYYHLDYVGGPRNYKWLNAVPIPKIWEQMKMAHQYGADRVWIVNVGHLQHVSFPMEFFLTFAWNPERWPKQSISDFTRLWAEREFGPAHAGEIADIIAKYTKYNGRRKPELLEPNTYSLVDYQEADRVQGEWKSITEKAEQLYQEMPIEARDAFYELVLFPTKACGVVNDLYITTGRNHLYASQGRASANDLAAQVRALFQTDAELTDCYNHKLANGKWDHMMDQTHIGYTYWQQPPANSMPKVMELEIPDHPGLGVTVEGSTAAFAGGGDPALPSFDCYNRPARYIDVFNRGKGSVSFTARANVPWLVLSATQGTVEKEARLWATVDWTKAPLGSGSGTVIISDDTTEVPVKAELFNPATPKGGSVKGFVEADGYVSIEADHYSKKVNAGGARWDIIPDFGRTLSSMSIFPMTAKSVTPPKGSPHLEYPLYLFSKGDVEVQAILAPSLNIAPDRGLRLGVSFDDEKPQVVTVVPKGYFVDNGNTDWEESVKDNARLVTSKHTVAEPGHHTLKIWMVDPGVALQKLVINTGGLKPSYLGPPESYRR